jgi:hypothetical protein
VLIAALWAAFGFAERARDNRNGFFELHVFSTRRAAHPPKFAHCCADFSAAVIAAVFR